MTPATSSPDADAGAGAARAIEAVFRIERARLVAGLARFTRDLDRAEELAQDARVAALGEWPRSGVPANPGAWLTAAAKRRAIDGFRRDRMLQRKHGEIARGQTEADENAAARMEAAIDDDLGDELLGLVFAACHPVLSRDARAALTLRLVCGLGTAEIARAFLTSEATVAQRIVRAKRTIATAGIPFAVPRGIELGQRLGSVLEVVYLVFNEGYAATAGEELTRPALCAEARRLARILAARLPGEPEVHGLLALVEIQSSRLAARVAPDGSAIPLPQQDRTRWDHVLIGRGLAALARAEALGGADGPYALQAALAACHARARRASDTDWPRIAALYDRLARVLPSPVVELNGAIAHGMAFGPAVGLARLDALARTTGPALDDYAPLWAARGDLLFRAGRATEAHPAFLRAAALSANARERDFLRQRAGACEQPPDPKLQPDRPGNGADR